MSSHAQEQHMLQRAEVTPKEISAPVGPFSEAIKVSNIKGMLFISGQIPIDPATDTLINDPKIATKQIMQNFELILKEAGMNFNNVVKTTILLADIKDFPIVNEEYRSFLAKPYPARETYQVAALPLGAIIEISMIAVE